MQSFLGDYLEVWRSGASLKPSSDVGGKAEGSVWSGELVTTASQLTA